ncbi:MULTISPECIES: DUF4200 domain-containing protein [Chryseobacterium]|uniref:Cell wall anchor protein n=1 Tax=Chryseobacterium gallinarum TaxID=1324352 RepID=A0ABX6KSR2_CHRGL|nr:MULTISPECIES: hypothetical protein [Chryseobacterium]QIY91652.1 cell wall anchor protein [Chryseobacterium gallinarum]
MKIKILSFSLLVSTFTLAQSWNTTGNAGTNPAINFIGTTDGQPLILKANNKASIRILPTGNVRIGLGDTDINPLSNLRVYNTGDSLLEVASSVGLFQIAKSGCNGCFGGMTGDTVLRNLGKSHTIILAMPNNVNDGGSYVGIQDGTNGTWVKFFNNAIAKIDGKVYAKEVEVKANVWADYVFRENYQLRTLEEIEKYIAEKGHLPDIPPAQEVMENGINIAQMDAKLLEKIEELTLYSIQQNKEIKKLQEENKTLKSQSEKIEKLEQQVQKLLSNQ